MHTGTDINIRRDKKSKNSFDVRVVSFIPRGLSCFSNFWHTSNSILNKLMNNFRLYDIISKMEKKKCGKIDDYFLEALGYSLIL